MRTHQACFFTVFFPANRPFVKRFLQSLSSQTAKNFDLVIINDGFDDLTNLLHQFPNLNVIVYDYSASIAKIREFGLKIIKEDGYKYAIFGDSDDYFSNNRVEYVLNSLQNYNICFNDLSLVDDVNNIFQKTIWGNRFLEKEEITLEFIEDKNVLGLGNSGINTNLFSIMNIPEDVLAVDWYIFHNLMKGQKAKFIPEEVTYYRQHGSNIVGKSKLTQAALNHIINVKEHHYRYAPPATESFIEEFNEFKSSSVDIDSYIKLINNKNLNYFWWEETNYLTEYKVKSNE